MMPDYGLGRLPAPDTRDRAYPMRALIREAPIRTVRHYRTGQILNQGATGTCVGHAWRQWLSSALLMTRGGPDAFTIYREACLIDPWSDNDNGDLQFGTSTRSGAKVLQTRGHIGEYRWTWQADEMADWLLLGKGVVIVGSDWYDGMFRPDHKGIIRPDGRVAGGHAYLISGVNRTTGYFRIANSWGESWGQRGRAWISIVDMQRLLDAGGEACAATEIHLP